MSCGRALPAQTASRPSTPADKSALREVCIFFPRRRPGDDVDACPPAPVLVTRKILEELKHLPIPVAAKKLGLCNTTFKKACRNVGIIKWPFRRGQLLNSESGEATPPETPIAFSRTISAPTAEPDDATMQVPNVDAYLIHPALQRSASLPARSSPGVNAILDFLDSKPDMSFLAEDKTLSFLSGDDDSTSVCSSASTFLPCETQGDLHPCPKEDMCTHG
jgi:hypothetical protein